MALVRLAANYPNRNLGPQNEPVPQSSHLEDLEELQGGSHVRNWPNGCDPHAHCNHGCRILLATNLNLFAVHDRHGLLLWDLLRRQHHRVLDLNSGDRDLGG